MDLESATVQPTENSLGESVKCSETLTQEYINFNRYTGLLYLIHMTDIWLPQLLPFENSFRGFLWLRKIIQQCLHANVKAGSIQNSCCYANVVRKRLAMWLRGDKPGYFRHYRTSEYEYMWEAWVTLTVNITARWFANDFHSLLRYSWKSQVNHHTCDKDIAIRWSHILFYR